jgi:5-methylcytosine-specific restriction endonuclease McrA
LLVTPPFPKSVQLAHRARPRRKHDADAALNFKQTVCSEPCLIGDGCDGPLQAAHVIPQQALKKRGLHHLLWDPANGAPLCYRHHRRHDNHTEKIPRSSLPAAALAWADTHGLTHVLERHWPVKGEA